MDVSLDHAQNNNSNNAAVQGDTVQIESFFQDLIPGFLRNRIQEFPLLEKMYFERDYEAMKKMGHKLGGTASSYGFQKLGELAKELEKAGQDQDVMRARFIIDQIRHHIMHVKIEYK